MSEQRTFRIPVSTGIFEHYKTIGEAIWLLLFLVDRTTKEVHGEGVVSGGAPISDADAARAFDCEVKTIRRWRKKLTDGGYIEAIRTPYGFRFKVRKSKKWIGANRGQISPPVDTEVQRELPNRAQRVTESGSQSARKGQNKEDSAVDSTNTNPPTRSLAGRLAGRFFSKTGLTLAASRDELARVSELIKQHSADVVARAFDAFMSRTSGFEGVHRPLALFFAEFDALLAVLSTAPPKTRGMSRAELEERRKRRALTPADEKLIAKMREQGRRELYGSATQTDAKPS